MSADEKKKKKRPSLRRFGKGKTCGPKAKRTAEEYEADLAIVADLWIEGQTPYEIAKYINSRRTYTVARTTVQNMLYKIKEEQKEFSIRERDQRCNEYVASMRHLISFCWKELKKTEQTAETVQRIVTRPNSKGKELKTTFVEKIQKDKQGLPDYLGTIKWANSEIARVYGVYAPTRVMAAFGEFGQPAGGTDGVQPGKTFPVQVTVKTEKDLGEVKVYRPEDIEIEPEPNQPGIAPQQALPPIAP